jgi:hypothetical protein
MPWNPRSVGPLDYSTHQSAWAMARLTRGALHSGDHLQPSVAVRTGLLYNLGYDEAFWRGGTYLGPPPNR